MATINLVFENGLSASASFVYDTVAPLASPNFTGTAVIPNITMSGSINNISAAELDYLNGVTSGIQSQFTAKAPLVAPTFTGAVVLPATTTIGNVSYQELSILDGASVTTAQLNILSGIASTLTSAELNILDGVTATSAELNNLVGSSSAIQTQLNGKQALPVYKADYATDAVALAFNTNDVAKVTPTANRTYTTTVPEASAGQRKALIVLTSGTSSFTLTFGSGFKTTGTLATGTVSAKVFVINFISDGVSFIETSRTTAM
jgi:hypothetical protein